MSGLFLIKSFEKSFHIRICGTNHSTTAFMRRAKMCIRKAIVSSVIFMELNKVIKHVLMWILQTQTPLSFYEVYISI